MFWNSAFLALVGVALTLIVSSLAGYGFEMFKSQFRDRIFGFLLLMLSIPFAALMVPLFIMMAQLKLINTFTAILLPGIASIFIIFYFRQATKAFPAELRDAARIDGLKEWQIFLYVYLPVMRSTYAAAIIIVFMANWNNYLWPLIVLQTEREQDHHAVVSSLSSPTYPDYGVDHDQRRPRHAAHPPHLLPPPAPLRRRHAGLCQIGLQRHERREAEGRPQVIWVPRSHQGRRSRHQGARSSSSSSGPRAAESRRCCA